MIHLNNGNKPHEWVSEQEFEKRHPETSKLLKQEPAMRMARYRRENLGLTIRELSRITGLTSVEISDFEIGAKTLEDEQIKLIEDALDQAERKIGA